MLYGNKEKLQATFRCGKFLFIFLFKSGYSLFSKKTFTLKTKPHVLRVSSKQPNGRIQQTLLSRIRKDNSEPDPDPQPWITSV